MSLMLDCGGKKASYEDLTQIRTPDRTETHVPVPHHEFVNMVRDNVPKGYKISAEEFGIHGSKFFGVLYLDHADKFNEDYSFTVGMRNCHGKVLKNSIAFGSKVFVCDNMCFSGTNVVHRKHTAHIIRDLGGIIEGIMKKARQANLDLDSQILGMKNRDMTQAEIHDLSVRLMDSGVLTPRSLKKTLEEYRRPKHSAFLPRTMWSYLNAVTESIKPPKDRGNFDLHCNRTSNLHEVCVDYQTPVMPTREDTVLSI